MKLKEIKVGDILKVNPTIYSHEKEPYYVEVIDKWTTGYKTSIPDRRELEISVDNGNLKYQLARMERVGDKGRYISYLYNQSLICN